MTNAMGQQRSDSMLQAYLPKKWKQSELVLILARSFVVGVLALTAASIGQYIHIEWQASPGIIWPAMGIVLSFMWLWGYWYGIPAFIGLIVGHLLGADEMFLSAALTSATLVVSGSVGVYVLKLLRFSGAFASMQDVLAFFVAAAIGSTVVPLLSLFVDGGVSSYNVFFESWVWYFFSCLVLSPLIFSWSTSLYEESESLTSEMIAVLIVLGSTVYLLSSTPLASEHGLLLWLVLFAAHFWVSLRFSARILSLAVFLSLCGGLLGLFLSALPRAQADTLIFGIALVSIASLPVFYVITALTARLKQTTGELKEALARIEAEDTRKGEFGAVLAHELRNPLAPIKTTLEILEMQSPEPELKDLIKDAGEQVHIMRRLLDDLLDVTLVKRGKFQLELRQVPFRKSIHNAIKSTETLLQAREHSLIFHDTRDDSMVLHVDPVRFEQALVNILNNAAKYTDKGGCIEIRYTVKRNMLELRISDNGRGIEREHLGEIFQPFWQKNASDPTTSGIGVGLSLTKHIIELHKGTIRVESEGRGKGATFIITLPLPAFDQHEPQLIASDVGRIKSFRILVIDDNVSAANSLKRLLTLKGHTVKAVYTGKDALDCISTFAPEVVLLDIGLPDMSGYEVARQVRANGYKDILIAISGYGQREDKEKAVEAGFNYHITKPMAIARLEEYLATVGKW